jgi:hypothetical protein
MGSFTFHFTGFIHERSRGSFHDTFTKFIHESSRGCIHVGSFTEVHFTLLDGAVDGHQAANDGYPLTPCES